MGQEETWSIEMLTIPLFNLLFLYSPYFHAFHFSSGIQPLGGRRKIIKKLMLVQSTSRILMSV